MTICNLCGEDIYEDNLGIGQTLKVVHEYEHQEEMERLGMTIEQYVEYCKIKVRN